MNYAKERGVRADVADCKSYDVFIEFMDGVKRRLEIEVGSSPIFLSL